MSFRDVKPEYAKYRILEEKNGFILAKDVDAKDFYMFGTEENFEKLSFPKSQKGKFSEIRVKWKNI